MWGIGQVTYEITIFGGFKNMSTFPKDFEVESPPGDIPHIFADEISHLESRNFGQEVHRNWKRNILLGVEQT